MKSVCVYCGSNEGNAPDFRDAAHAMGTLLAERGIRVVYGGGNVGLMGVLANAALEAGGEVIGVIPGHLMELELGHTGVTDLRVVDSMHERKALMMELADGFISLPGSIGTLEETFEALTWCQLGLHPKPCALLNLNGYYDSLVALLDNIVQHGFMPEHHLELLCVEAEPKALLDRLIDHEPRHTDKWIERR